MTTYVAILLFGMDLTAALLTPLDLQKKISMALNEGSPHQVRARNNVSIRGQDGKCVGPMKCHSAGFCVGFEGDTPFCYGANSESRARLCPSRS